MKIRPLTILPFSPTTIFVMVTLKDSEVDYMRPTKETGWSLVGDDYAVKSGSIADFIKRCRWEISDWEEAVRDHDELPRYEGYNLWCELLEKLKEFEQHLDSLITEFDPPEPSGELEEPYDPFPESEELVTA